MRNILKNLIQRQAALNECLKRGDGKGLEKYSWVSKGGSVVTGNLMATESYSDEDASATFIVSTINEDRDGDIVVPKGISLNNYRKNPVFMFGHQEPNPFPIGVARTPDGGIAFWAEEKLARATCYFDKEDADAMFIHGKVKRGFLNATSIAFVPIEAYKRDEYEKSYRNGDRDSMMPMGWMFKRVDLTEISIVSVPSNAGAIRDALDAEKSFITPQLQKALTPYAAQPRGRCFSGWCPVPAKAMKRVTVQKEVTEDANPYQDKGCPICGEHAVGSCRCRGPHSLEQLEKGHGLRCPNGHRFSHDSKLVFDPQKAKAIRRDTVVSKSPRKSLHVVSKGSPPPKVGDTVIHPIYGEGNVYAVNGDRVSIKFPKQQFMDRPWEWAVEEGAKIKSYKSVVSKDLCPNNGRITLSDDYGCPEAFDSARRGRVDCKGCGKSLDIVPFRLKGNPVKSTTITRSITKGDHLSGAARDAGKKAALNDLVNQSNTSNPYAGGINESEWQRAYDTAKQKFLSSGFWPGQKVGWTLGSRSYTGVVIPPGTEQGYTKVRIERIEGRGSEERQSEVGRTSSIQTSGLTKKSLTRSVRKSVRKGVGDWSGTIEGKPSGLVVAGDDVRAWVGPNKFRGKINWKLLKIDWEYPLPDSPDRYLLEREAFLAAKSKAKGKSAAKSTPHECGCHTSGKSLNSTSGTSGGYLVPPNQEDEDMKTKKPATQKAAISSQEDARVYREGYEAGKRGETSVQCPYQGTRDSQGGSGTERSRMRAWIQGNNDQRTGKPAAKSSTRRVVKAVRRKDNAEETAQEEATEHGADMDVVETAMEESPDAFGGEETPEEEVAEEAAIEAVKAPHSAHALAKMNEHLRAAKDWMEGEDPMFEPDSGVKAYFKEELGPVIDDHLAKMGEMFGERYPDQDMAKLCGSPKAEVDEEDVVTKGHYRKNNRGIYLGDKVLVDAPGKFQGKEGTVYDQSQTTITVRFPSGETVAFNEYDVLKKSAPRRKSVHKYAETIYVPSNKVSEIKFRIEDKGGKVRMGGSSGGYVQMDIEGDDRQIGWAIHEDRGPGGEGTLKDFVDGETGYEEVEDEDGIEKGDDPNDTNLEEEEFSNDLNGTDDAETMTEEDANEIVNESTEEILERYAASGKGRKLVRRKNSRGLYLGDKVLVDAPGKFQGKEGVIYDQSQTTITVRFPSGETATFNEYDVFKKSASPRRKSLTLKNLSGKWFVKQVTKDGEELHGPFEDADEAVKAKAEMEDGEEKDAGNDSYFAYVNGKWQWIDGMAKPLSVQKPKPSSPPPGEDYVFNDTYNRWIHDPRHSEYKSENILPDETVEHQMSPDELETYLHKDEMEEEVVEMEDDDPVEKGDGEEELVEEGMEKDVRRKAPYNVGNSRGLYLGDKVLVDAPGKFQGKEGVVHDQSQTTITVRFPSGETVAFNEYDVFKKSASPRRKSTDTFDKILDRMESKLFGRN